MVARCLAADPEASGFHGTGVPEDEGQHLQSVMPAAWRLGGPGRFAWHPDAHLTEDSPLARPDACDRLWSAWAPHWDLGMRVLVEKSPPNLLRTRLLQRLFPGAAFVLVVRHPLAVAHATRRWCPDATRSLLAHWFHAHTLLAADLPHVDRVAIVRYEDLVADPAAALAPAAALLGLAAVPHDAVRPERDRPYRALTAGDGLPAHWHALGALFGYQL